MEMGFSKLADNAKKNIGLKDIDIKITRCWLGSSVLEPIAITLDTALE